MQAREVDDEHVEIRFMVDGAWLEPSHCPRALWRAEGWYMHSGHGAARLSSSVAEVNRGLHRRAELLGLPVLSADEVAEVEALTTALGWLVRGDTPKDQDAWSLIHRFAASIERPVYSAREAMRDAGLTGWEMGKGMSSADAIRELAKQRDDERLRLTELANVVVHEYRNAIMPVRHALRMGVRAIADERLVQLDDAVKRLDALMREHVVPAAEGKHRQSLRDPELPEGWSWLSDNGCVAIGPDGRRVWIHDNADRGKAPHVEFSAGRDAEPVEVVGAVLVRWYAQESKT